MSFRCGICHKPQPPHTKPVKVVVERRKKHYSAQVNDGVLGREGKGWEVVREVDCCSRCVK